MEYVVAVCLIAKKCCRELPGISDIKAYRHRTRLICSFRCGACEHAGVRELVEVEPDESFASGYANHMFDEHPSEIFHIFGEDRRLAKRVKNEADLRAFRRVYCDLFQDYIDNKLTDDKVQEEERQYLAARTAAKTKPAPSLAISTAEVVSEPAPVTPPPPQATAGHTPVRLSPPLVGASRNSFGSYLPLAAAVLLRQPRAWEQPHCCREHDDVQVCHETEGSQGHAHHSQEGNRHTRQCSRN
jgi:hypothetical protein